MRIRTISLAAGALIAAFAFAPAPAGAQVSCPNPNAVVNENNCQGAGSLGWRLSDYSEEIGGFATQSSVDLGQNVVLKIGRDAPTFPETRVDISVYRLGYYDGQGGRLIPAASATNVVVNNSFDCNPMNATTGLLSCANWQPTYTIPGSTLPASGVYIAKLRATDTNWDSQIYFTVRDDARNAAMLYVLPTSDFEAYNSWGGKSLYFDKNGGPSTISGTGRAVKVSFDRPLDFLDAERNKIRGADFPMIYWLERQGYDVSYTDQYQVHLNRPELLQHNALIIGGHSEYWSGEELANVKAARDAGVDVASFSANTAYWKVRYEDNGRTLVCYKTVQGSGTDGSGAATPNDPGPDGVSGTADDALGADGTAGTGDDRPQNTTTTFRDNGAPPGDPNAPPGGRVGPNTPENALFGVMFFGQHEAMSWPLTVPAGNGNSEFAADRIWRNTGIPSNSSTTIGSDVVGWEWDAVPTQSQYLAHQPAGVKRLSATNTSNPASTWLQDEGRVYSTSPPPGQPSTVNAVKYTAPSGALVFASGTMQWSWELSYSVDLRLWQATYNVFSDMGVQPLTPESVTLDNTPNQLPSASFTVSPNPALTGETVTFNGSASSDPDGSISRYEWDLDGNGSYETDTGATPTTSRSYTTGGTVTVGLRVTDNRGGTATTTRSLTVNSTPNQSPTASFTVAPNPAQTGNTVTFNGSASSDPDGTISKYEWDLDGNGSFETDTGAAPTASRSYSTPGTVNVQLRVTDNRSATATTQRTLTVEQGQSTSYSQAVLGTSGLQSYWRMGDPAGTTLVDSRGSSPATISGGPALGAPGALPGDPDTAVSFDGANDAATAQVNLSGTNKVTVEFWLRWDAFADDDDLALEFTPNFNGNPGGFLIDPNAPGGFGIGIGNDLSRNNAYFTRPSAGAWHHYAFVLDTVAAASGQITPYVDGQPVSYSKTASGTGAGNFANSQLFFMSRAAAALFGSGDLDELAIYNQALSAATIGQHYAAATNPGSNAPPIASFTASPSSPTAGQVVTFNGSASSDPDGTIVKYEWDLDGNGSFETDTGTNPVTTHTYATAGSVAVKLRVTDNGGDNATATQTVTVGAPNQAPTASFTATPSTATTGQAVSFNGSASSDPDGTIAKYEWDLDGNGSFETDTGTTATTSRTYTQNGTFDVKLRVTDNGGGTAQATRTVTITNRGPTASFTVTPNPALTNQTVTFNGSGSSDPDGTISKYEWDLDGNGSFETDTGATSTTTRTYPQQGTFTIRLRTTDDDGATNETTRTLTVNNQTPTASFTVTPSAPQTRQNVTFNGGASADGDGTIIKYEWDLDADGTYETDTATSSTVTRVYDTPGAKTFRLRVTDDDGATGTTTRNVTISSAYAASVTSVSGLRGYWRLSEAQSTTTAADSSGRGSTGTYVSGPLVTSPLIAGEQNNARDFDGSAQYVNATPSPFGTPNRLTAEAWVQIDTTKSAAGYHFLITNANVDFDDGFSLVINEQNRPVLSVSNVDNKGNVSRGQAVSSVALTPGVKNFVAGTYDGSRVRIYVNGVERGSVAFSPNPTWASGRDLFLGRQKGSTLLSLRYLDGKLDEAAVYNVAISATVGSPGTELEFAL